MIEVYCPRCDIYIPVTTEWESGECPGCKREFYWTEVCAEDYSDCWSEIYWEDDDD
jgi:primosomal protein N'